ncbi:MAG: ComF family protein [Syntrophaceae bacterium]|nr:ComF family protein [Syntrophaceae bacterium]
MICKTKKIVSGLVDILFPRRCMVCGLSIGKIEPPPFCPECVSLINFIRAPLCISCGMPFADTYGTNHLCGDCISSRPPFAVARALGMYEKTLLDAIHLFKYNGKIAMGEILGEMMAQYDYDSLDIRDYSLLMPVPLHTLRLKKRGFNQALILARHIAHKFSLPLDFTTLKRSVDTKPQVNLGRSERVKNIKGAFEVAHEEKIRGKKILLVDDVYTTGSTVRECARVLIEKGAKEVSVFTLARA